jgi:hypothetical protein
MRATDGTTRSLSIFHDRDAFVRAFVTTSTIAAVTTAAFLLARRAAGAFSDELPAPQLFIVATIALAWAIAVRELSHPSAIIPSIAITVLLALAIACSYPGARILDWLIWPAVMLEAVFLPALRRPRVAASLRSKIRRGEDANSGLGEIRPREPDETILQQLTRIRLDDKREAIRGELTAEFTTGERQTTIYVAFCPPFERLPQIEANIADDSDATVKVAQFLHNGAQLEVRLPDPAEEPFHITVELYAEEPSSP